MYLKYKIKRRIRLIKHYVEARVFSKRIPAPYSQKWHILFKFFEKGSLSIETGTYLGETTNFLSLNIGPVISIEPYSELANYNKERFKKNNNVKIINQKSQEALSGALGKKFGTINFWLDGHFSGEGTFGDLESASPILDELLIIKKWLTVPENRANIAIDDARLFTGQDGYPTLTQMQLISEQMNCSFTIDKDIILMRSNEL